MKYTIAYDPTKFVRATNKEIVSTLFLDHDPGGTYHLDVPAGTGAPP